MRKIAAIGLSAAMLMSSGTTLLAREPKNSDERPAESTELPVEIKTAQDFISTYAGTEVEADPKVKDSGGFVWFTEAALDNYETILAGSTVFLTLNQDLQKQILKACEMQKIDYETLVQDAEAIREEESAKAAAKAQKEREEKEQAEARAKEEENKKAEELRKADEAKKEEEAEKTEKAAEDPKTSRPAKKEGSDQIAAPASPQPQQKQPASDSSAAKETPAEESAGLTEQKTLQPADLQDSKDNSSTSAEIQAGTDGSRQPDQMQAQNSAQSSSELSQESSSQNSDGTQTADTVQKEDQKNENTDQNESEADENTDAKPAAEAVTLYQSTLKAGALGTIAVEAEGNAAGNLSQNMNDALDAWIKEKNWAAWTPVFGDVVFRSSKDDLFARSIPFTAVQSPEGLIPLTFSDNGQTVELTIYSPATMKVDYKTNTITLGVKDSYSWTIPQQVDENKSNGSGDQIEIPDDHSEAASSGHAAGGSLVDETENQPAVKTAPVMASAVTSTVSAIGGIAGSTQSQQTKPVQTLSQSAAELTEPVVQNTQEKNLPVSQNLNAPASSFIRQYCSNAAGQIYTQAWSANYKQILSGYRIWRTLSQSEKEQVNSELKSVGGMTYLALYRQAHRINLGLSGGVGGISRPVSTGKVDTASHSHQTFWLSASLISLIAAAGSIFQLRKNRNQEKMR